MSPCALAAAAAARSLILPPARVLSADRFATAGTRCKVRAAPGANVEEEEIF